MGWSRITRHVESVCACSSVDRVPGYEPVGRRFESCQARQAGARFCSGFFCLSRPAGRAGVSWCGPQLLVEKKACATFSRVPWRPCALSAAGEPYKETLAAQGFLRVCRTPIGACSCPFGTICLMPPNPMKAKQGCGPRSPGGFSTSEGGSPFGRSRLFLWGQVTGPCRAAGHGCGRGPCRRRTPGWRPRRRTGARSGRRAPAWSSGRRPPP